MPTRRYALSEGGPERLELSWKWNWRDLVVRFDGQQVAGPFRKEELGHRVAAALPDGSTLDIALDRHDLHVMRDGVPLPGSASDPRTQLKAAYGAIFFLAGLNLVVGICAATFGWQALIDMGGGIGSIVYGAILGLLGLFVVQRSRVALALALGLYVLDSLITLAAAAMAGHAGGVHGIFLRILLMTLMWRGFAAIGELKRREEHPPLVVG